MLPERSDALVGSTLGKDYRVLQVIGTGGMAVVYLVEHQTLLKRFAATVLSSELASSAEARERSRPEIGRPRFPGRSQTAEPRHEQSDDHDLERAGGAGAPVG